VATAVRKANGNLEVTVFDVSNSGALTPRGSGGGGQIDVMAIQSLAADTVVTSVRGGADKLKVIRWKIGSDGSIGRDGEEDSIEVGVIDCAGSQSFVTAVSDRDGNLRLLHWLQGRASGIFRGGSGGGGEIAAVRIAGDGGATGRWFTASTDPGPTAVRTGVFGGGRLLIGAGVLKVIEWRLVEPVSDRSDLQRRGEAQVAGSDGISFDLALTRADPGSFFVTAAASVGSYRRALPRDRGKPLLKLTVWELNDSITPLTSATLGGEYDSLSIATIRNPQGNDHRFVTAVRGTGDQLKLNVWDFLP
jgi:hypothetical protein